MKRLVQSIIYFLHLTALHLLLLHLFVLGYYTLYFVALFFISYGVYRYSRDISLFVLFLLLTLLLIFINTQTYEEMIFEAYLYLNATHYRLFVYSEVLYTLLVLHIALFLNLKKFDKIWDIIEEKLFRD